MESPGHLPGRVQIDQDNPWPGLESYDESSCDFFSGRAAEADDLQRRILDEPTTVLFGKSGLGKTSLLKAGVFPRLREKGWLPIFPRLQLRPGIEALIEQVRLALFDELRVQEIEHSALSSGETLWEYLHGPGREFWTKKNRLLRPVFVIDQFEEIFTHGRLVPAHVEAFREDLADLAENRIPAALAHRLENRTESDLNLDEQAMPYKVVIALREDFLADLEGWRLTMPSLRRNRMRLLPMGPEQALRAVCNERTNHLVSETLARRIVAFLLSAVTNDGDRSPQDTGLTVEPALLSLFCRGVNEHRKLGGKAHFDEALIEGGKGTIVTDFYRSSLKDQPERVRRFIEEELITEHGFRNSYSVDDALDRKYVTAEELEALINRHLLRHEHHLGAERVELTHDLLTKAVVEERDYRRRAERSAGEQRRRRTLWEFASACAVVALIFAGVAAFAWNARNVARATQEVLAKTLKVKETMLAIEAEYAKQAEQSRIRSDQRRKELNDMLAARDATLKSLQGQVASNHAERAELVARQQTASASDNALIQSQSDALDQKDKLLAMKVLGNECLAAVVPEDYVRPLAGRDALGLKLALALSVPEEIVGPLSASN